MSEKLWLRDEVCFLIPESEFVRISTIIWRHILHTFEGRSFLDYRFDQTGSGVLLVLRFFNESDPFDILAPGNFEFLDDLEIYLVEEPIIIGD